MANRISAVVTDVDGTICGPDGSVSAAVLAAARELRLAGIPLILATARTPAEITILGPVLADVTLAVCCNGSIGYDPAAAATIWREQVPAQLASDLAAVLAAELPAARFGAYDGQGWTVCPGCLDLPTWLPVGPAAVASVQQVCDVRATALGICHPSLRAAEVAAVIALSGVLAGRASLSYGGDAMLDVMPAGVSKGTGVVKALAIAGIDPLDAVGFGDAQNDLPVAAVLGSFVAMGNADPEVLAAATDVTGTVAADGVATWLAANTRPPDRPSPPAASLPRSSPRCR
jgi:hydroxymethylpyrimidine pyrophosphatase-like HAD family hydrolase